MESLDFPLLGYKALTAVQFPTHTPNDWELVSPLFPAPSRYYSNMGKLPYWEDGRLEAVCYNGGKHRPPGQMCPCGIYGTFNLRQATHYVGRFWLFPTWVFTGVRNEGLPEGWRWGYSVPAVLGRPVEFWEEVARRKQEHRDTMIYLLRGPSVEVVIRGEGRAVLQTHQPDWRLGGWRAAAASIEGLILPLEPRYNPSTGRLNSQYRYLTDLDVAQTLYKEMQLFVRFFSQKFGVPVLTRRQAVDLVSKTRREVRRAGLDRPGW